MLVALSDMTTGQAGVIREVTGGFGLVRRLNALGIRPGKAVVRLTTHLWGGPVLVRIDTRTIAVGFGMARRVLVEVTP